MEKKRYEKPDIVVLRLESEIWFAMTVPSFERGEEGGSDGDSNNDVWGN